MSAAASDRLAALKDRPNCIVDEWHRRGYQGEPRSSCRCPWHDDKNQSFSVYDKGRRFKCFAGCGQGTLVDFVAIADGTNGSEASKRLLSREGGSNDSFKRSEHPKQEPVRQEQLKREPARLEVPSAKSRRRWSKQQEELAERAAISRGLQKSAVMLGVLWFDTIYFDRVCGYESWVVTDNTHKVAEARRIDGQLYRPTDNLSERKSHALRGSQKNWPIGLLSTTFSEQELRQRYQRILLCEGGPDYLSACQLLFGQADLFAFLPCAMLGAGIGIADEALPYFADRQIAILAHPDKAGRGGADRWAKQIEAAGGLVRIFKFKDGDLNDHVAAGASLNDLSLFRI
jgi:hypothetical protein